MTIEKTKCCGQCRSNAQTGNRKIEIDIPGEPVAKARARVTRQGGAFTPKKTRKWERLAGMMALAAIGRAPFLTGPLRVTVNAYFAIPKSWPAWKNQEAAHENVWHTSKVDYDNVAKAVGDALQDIIYKNDSSICSASVYMRYSANPRVMVTVQEMGGLHTHSLKSDLDGEI